MTSRRLWLLAGLLAACADFQRGAAADLAGAFAPGGVGALASASRGVQYAQELDVRASVRAAHTFRDDLNAALGVTLI